MPSSADPAKEARRLRAQAAIESLSAQSKLNGLDEMSMDEINAEIAIVRAEAKKRSEIERSKV